MGSKYFIVKIKLEIWSGEKKMIDWIISYQCMVNMLMLLLSEKIIYYKNLKVQFELTMLQIIFTWKLNYKQIKNATLCKKKIVTNDFSSL